MPAFLVRYPRRRRPAADPARTAAEVLITGGRAVERALAAPRWADWPTASACASGCTGLRQTLARWDGKGHPAPHSLIDLVVNVGTTRGRPNRRAASSPEGRPVAGCGPSGGAEAS